LNTGKAEKDEMKHDWDGQLSKLIASLRSIAKTSNIVNPRDARNLQSPERHQAGIRLSNTVSPLRVRGRASARSLKFQSRESSDSSATAVHFEDSATKLPSSDSKRVRWSIDTTSGAARYHSNDMTVQASLPAKDDVFRDSQRRRERSKSVASFPTSPTVQALGALKRSKMRLSIGAGIDRFMGLPSRPSPPTPSRARWHNRGLEQLEGLPVDVRVDPRWYPKGGWKPIAGDPLPSLASTPLTLRRR
jgi:hypothetical protein